MSRSHIISLSCTVAAVLLSACAAPGTSTGDIGPAPSSSTESAIVYVPAMPETTDVAAPIGYIGFCIRMPDQCQTPKDASNQLTLTPRTWQLLLATNQKVNDSIWPEEDQKHYGRAEYWTIPTDGYGDCEDFALTKRKALMDAGLPEPALRIAVVVTSRHESHAVLTVTTDKGDYVLDSLRDDIRSWNEADYIWIERQDSTRPSGWASLQPSKTLMVATAATGAVSDPVSH